MPQIATIYDHYVRHTYITFEKLPPSPEQWHHKWLAAQQANHPWMVGERAGTVCGYATALTFNPKPAYDPTVETSIYLHPERLGEGLGRGLYQRLLDEVDERDFHTAVAGIALPNERSIALHESLGFQLVGVFREVGHKLGDWRDVGWWQRALIRSLT